MASTYEPIASQTISGSSTTTVTFSNIPSTYTDLRIVMRGTYPTTGTLRFRFNADTATNYSWTDLYGDGSSAASVRSSNDTSCYLASISTGETINTADVMSYSNTNVFKTCLVTNARPDALVQRFANLWRSTSAITSIALFATTAAYISAGSTFDLYGVKAA